MARGELRVYLGAAPGVGKTFAMLAEGHRRRDRGTDVVVAAVDTGHRPRTEELLAGLEVVPPVRPASDGCGAEVDVEGVLGRRPRVALVDDLARTNPPGARHPHRWEDVEELLAAGIDVVATLDVEHLASVSAAAAGITGVPVDDVIPDEVVRAADQIELVDMAPEALRRRLAHGNVLPPGAVDASLSGYFRLGNLYALRELALLWLLDRVDDRLRSYLDDHDMADDWTTRERVVVAVTGAPTGATVIRRAARIAEQFHGELIGVHVGADRHPDARSDVQLEANRALLTDLGGSYHEVADADVAGGLVAFARAERATQLVLGATGRPGRLSRVRGSVVGDVLARAAGLEVHVVDDPAAPPARSLPPRREGLGAGRHRLGWALLAVALPVLTLTLAATVDHLTLASVMLLYVVLVTAVAAVGGRGPGIVAAVVSSAAVNFFFTPPVHTFIVATGDNLLALGIFLVVALVVSELVSRLAERRAEADRARQESEVLLTVAAGLSAADPLQAVTEQVRASFDLDGASVLRRADGGWLVEAAAGTDPPVGPDGCEVVALAEGVVLALDGPPLVPDDRRVLHAFADQLAAALDQERLRHQAQAAQADAEADRLRTAILRSVSHDLRTPLASIKASVSSLRQGDVDWSAHTRAELLATIDEEADRLNRIIADLLDMSRLEAGAVAASVGPTYLDEVVEQALAGLPRQGPAVVVDVSELLPPVAADRALLERAVENLVANALRYTPPGEVVHLTAARLGDRVVLQVVDHGPGIPRDQREQVVQPFHRLGDGQAHAGVGLGLAVAQGMLEAFGSRLELDDTPGGGLTATIDLAVTDERVAAGGPQEERP